MTSIGEIFEKIVRIKGKKIALIEESNSLNFRDLNLRSAALAKTLGEMSIKTGSVIALHLPRGINYVIAMFAVIRSRCTFVPIDPNLSENRKSIYLEEVGANVIITTKDLKKGAFEIPEIVVDEVQQVFPSRWTRQVDDSIPLYIIFTSGSTGTPKGVRGSHAGLLNRVQWMECTFPYFENEVLFQKTSMNFVDHIAEIFQALLSGQSLVILNDEQAKDTSILVRTVAEHEITRIVLVPSLLRVISTLDSNSLTQLESLRFVFCSGETLSKSLAHIVTEKLPWIRLINIYGSTEVSADATYHEFEDHIKERINRLFLPSKKKENKERKLLPELIDRFEEIKIPEKGIDEKEYDMLFERDYAAHAIDVSDPLFIGHMTSGIPKYFHELAKKLTELNQNLVKEETSGGFTYLEKQTVAQFHRLIYDLPKDIYDQNLFEPTSCFGITLNGGTLGNIQALYAARQLSLMKRGISKEAIEKEGFHRVLQKCGYRNAVIIGSKRMHYSMKKACLTFGMGDEQLVTVDTDSTGGLDISKLHEVIIECRRNNWLIIAIVGIAGATETGAIDPLEKIAELTNFHEIHFHVDAAWGGIYLFSSELRKKFIGIERADTVSICGHKQLYLPMGTSLLLFKKPDIASKITFHSAYQACKGSQDLGQFSLIGSKPAVASYLHAGLHLIGMSGYRYLAEQGFQKAQFFAQLIEKSDAFQLVGKPQLNIVNYRYLPERFRKHSSFTDDEQWEISKLTREMQKEQFRRGKSFVSFTELPSNGNKSLHIGVFRAVILNPLTSYDDFAKVLNDQLKIAEEYIEEPPQKPIAVCPLHQEVMSVPIGRPIDNTSIYLLDENMKEVPIGNPGEIYIGGAVLSEGYCNNRELTKKHFISHPKDPRIRLFRTGDFGRRLSSGSVEFLGRKDQQVKIRGVRIEITELEERIRQFEEVQQVAVIVKKINEEFELIVFYTSDQKLGESILRDQLLREFPAYMVPSRWNQLDTFPLLPSGKIDCKALLDWKTADPAQEIIFDEDPLKEKILRVMRKVDPHVIIASNRNFFEMGFNSLSLNLITTEIKKEIGEEVDLLDLYTYSNLEKLSDYISRKSQAPNLNFETGKMQTSRRDKILRLRKQTTQHVD